MQVENGEFGAVAVQAEMFTRQPRTLSHPDHEFTGYGSDSESGFRARFDSLCDAGVQMYAR